MNVEERRWVNRWLKQALISTCSCSAAASCSWVSRAQVRSGQPVAPPGVSSCSAVLSWGCCVSSSVESVRRIARSASCNPEIGTHAVSLPYVFEYVLSGVRDGGKPYRTTGTCRVEGDPVGRRLRADHQSLGASLRRRPYFSVLLLPALVGSLPVFVSRPRVLSQGRTGAADSADLKNLLLKMRVACDRRRSESRHPRLKFYRDDGTVDRALL
jgi:hypothetical protein